MFVNKDELRRLANKKASRPMMGQGIPEPTDGIDGDFRLNNTPTGVKLYAKFAGQWFSFSPDSGIDSTGKTHCLHGGFTLNNTNVTYWYMKSSGGVTTSSTGDSYADNIWFVAPWNGKVKNITIKGAFATTIAAGDVDIRIWKSGDGTNVSGGTLIGNEEITFNSRYQTMTANYTGADFQAGDAIKFGHEVQESSWPTTVYCTWSALIEIDN